MERHLLYVPRPCNQAHSISDMACALIHIYSNYNILSGGSRAAFWLVAVDPQVQLLHNLWLRFMFVLSAIFYGLRYHVTRGADCNDEN